MMRDEIIDFLLSAPTLEQVIALHASESSQERLRYLLDRNRNNALTDAERADLDEMMRWEFFVQDMKIRAHELRLEREKKVEAV
jgi:hypothetical protein